MKKILILFLIVAALLLAAPGVIGNRAEEQYRMLIDRLEQSGLKVERQAYRQGWFGAMADTVFRVQIPASYAGSEMEERRFTLHSDISHGPLTMQGLGLATIDSRILVAGEDLFTGSEGAPIQTLIGLYGKGQTHLDLAPGEQPLNGGDSVVRFQGLAGDIQFDLTGEQMTARLMMPGMSIETGGENVLSLNEAAVDYKAWRGVSGLILGSGDFRLQQLSIKDTEGSRKLLLNGLGIEVESREVGELIAGMATYRLESLRLEDKVYGPGQLKVELGRLPAPVLVSIQQAIEDFQRNPMSETEQEMALMSLFLSSGPKLLAKDPYFSLQPVWLETPEGRMEADFFLRPVGLRWTELLNIQVVLNKLEMEASLRMPEKLLLQLLEQQARARLEQQNSPESEENGGEAPLTPDQLSSLSRSEADWQLELWLSQEFLKREGKDVLTVAALSGGLLTVNGKNIPLPQLGQ